MEARLAAERARCNNQRGPERPRLVWSVGRVMIDPLGADTLDRLLVEADRRMYEVKRASQIADVTNGATLRL
jgi:GGDEF domain-containing protein